MPEPESQLSALTERIIGCAYTVANTLGAGFLEKVYENSLAIELRKAGLKVLQQVEYRVMYEGQEVGKYVADLVVNDAVLLELKSVKEFDAVHTAMCINYLKVSGLSLCLLINFGKSRVEVKRIVL
ncbi:MAG: GxxExxY protein [Planctomycetes bacterium]|nr:GxxExxY protein [Planctomycetota bacterium]